MGKQIKVKLIKSINGKTAKQKSCITGLGLRKIGSESTLENTPSVRGMIKKVIHMVEIEE